MRKAIKELKPVAVSALNKNCFQFSNTTLQTNILLQVGSEIIKAKAIIMWHISSFAIVPMIESIKCCMKPISGDINRSQTNTINTIRSKREHFRQFNAALLQLNDIYDTI